MRATIPRILAGALLLLAAGCGADRGPAAEADMQIITHGTRVEIADHLAHGKYTVIDFYAPWCPPCRALGPALERLAAAERGRLALRKVDIVDWTMPVVDQYGIESLPHLMLYDPDGRRIGDGDAVFKMLSDLFGASAREVDAVAGDIGAGDAPPAEPEAGDKRSVL